jgi:rhomboid family GlyGly-CTERM serine protease
MTPEWTVRQGLDSRHWASALNCDGRYGLGLLAACTLLLLPQLWGNAATHLLRYDRAAMTGGQWWRLLTAQFAHLGLHHALLNTLGLVLVWALFAREWKPLQWVVIVVIVTVAIDAGLWFLDPGISWYVGASGALHGCMVAGAVASIRRRDPLGWILAGVLVLKLTYEHFHGPLPFAGKGVPVVVAAHLYGAVGGLLAAIAQNPKPPVRQTPLRGSIAPQT